MYGNSKSTLALRVLALAPDGISYIYEGPDLLPKVSLAYLDCPVVALQGSAAG